MPVPASVSPKFSNSPATRSRLLPITPSLRPVIKHSLSLDPTGANQHGPDVDRRTSLDRTPRLRRQFVCRVSGLPANVVDGLRAERSYQLVDLLHQTEAQLEGKRECVSRLLYDAIGSTSDKQSRSVLLHLRRSLYNLKPALSEGLPTLREILSEADYKQVEQTQTAISERERLTRRLEATFRQEELATRRVLLSIARQSDFQKGLLHSSPSLHRALQRAITKNDPGRGWDEKFERGLLRYLTRASMKATPFARFCAVVVGRFEERSHGRDERQWFDGDPFLKRGFVRLNKSICALLLDHLKGHPTIRGHLPVGLNPTLRVEDALLYLSQIEGREVFQRLRRNSVLDALVAKLRLQPFQPLNDLARAVSTSGDFDATYEDGVNYLRKLLEVGLLQFRLGVPEQEADWDLPLRDIVEKIPENDTRAVVRLLSNLRRQLELYSNASVTARAAISLDVHDRVAAQLKDMGFGNDLNQGLLFYEDCTADTEARIHLDPRLNAAVAELELFVAHTMRLGAPRADMASMRAFFDQKYQDRTSVPLLEFYEDYYRDHLHPHVELEKRLKSGDTSEDVRTYDPSNPYRLPLVSALNAANMRISELLRRRWAEYPGADEITIAPAELASTVADIEPLPQDCRSVSAFVQLNQGHDLDIILQGGSYLPGYGKYYSRFVYMFPEKAVARIRRDNRRITAHMLAEICGDAQFNANLHPPLVDWQISYPTGESGAEAAQLASPELQVQRHPRDSNALMLVHSQNGERVLPVDLGFLNVKMRPPLFQLLSKFAPVSQFSLQLPLSPMPPAEVGTAKHGSAAKAEVVHRPRIRFGRHVVLARRQWAIPSTIFPSKRVGEESWKYFLRINGWRAEHGIPEKVYVKVLPGPSAPLSTLDFVEPAADSTAEDNPGPARIEADEPGGAKSDSASGAVPSGQVAERHRVRDSRKPQYIDFASPALVALFGKLALNLDSFMVVAEECLPTPDNLPLFGENTFATELTIQMDLAGRDDATPTQEGPSLRSTAVVGT